jgi:hypothetical protein
MVRKKVGNFSSSIGRTLGLFGKTAKNIYIFKIKDRKAFDSF